MGAQRVDEKKLEVDVSFNEISSGLGLSAVNQICVFHADEVMEPIFDNIPIYHVFISCFHLRDLLLDFALEDDIKFIGLLVLMIFSPVMIAIFYYQNLPKLKGLIV